MAIQLSRLSRFRSPYDVLGYMLRLLSALWHRQLNARLAEIDLTEMQFVILMGLGWLQEGRAPGVSQRELAKSCSCSAALASQVIKSLVRKKLVSTARNRDDGRAQLVKLTMRGEDRIAAALKVTDEVDSEFWASEPRLAEELSHVLRAMLTSKCSREDAEAVGAMPGLMDQGISAVLRSAS